MLYYYNNYELDVVRRDNDVIITCLDKALHKSFQETITTEKIAEVGNVENFLRILDHVFNNNQVIILSNNDKLDVIIKYNNILEFDIMFSLWMLEQTQITANSLYIEKLEKHIKFLEDRIICPIAYQNSQYFFSNTFINKLIIIVTRPLSGYGGHFNDLDGIKKIGCSLSYETKNKTLIVSFFGEPTYWHLKDYFFTICPKEIIFEEDPSGYIKQIKNKSLFPQPMA